MRKYLSTNVLGHRIGRRSISTYEKKNRSCLMGKKKKHFLRFLNPGFFIFGSKRWLRDGIFSNFYFELDRKISETAKSRGSGFENLENIPSEQSRKSRNPGDRIMKTDYENRRDRDFFIWNHYLYFDSFFRIFKLKMKMNFPFRLALQSPTSSK